jgi:hypothetical protein
VALAEQLRELDRHRELGNEIDGNPGTEG